MQLNNLVITARPRTPWQAMDLGIRFAIQHYIPLVFGWLLWATPVLALSMLWLEPWYALAIIWWLKPLFERWQLFYLSQALFASPPPFKQVITRAHKFMLPQIFWALTIRRFSWSRSFNLAVTLLEGLKGAPRRRRIELLERREPTLWMTLGLVHVEYFIYSALFALLFLWVPSNSWDIEFFFNNTVSVICYFITYALIAPLFSSMGFVAYINRRIHLEGWDIQIQFQRLASRLAGVVLALILAMPLFAPQQAYAKTPEQSREDMEQLYQGPPIVNKETSRVPKFLDDWLNKKDEEKKQRDFDIDTPKQVSSTGLGIFTEILLWGAVITIVGFLIYYLAINYRQQQSLVQEQIVPKKAVIRPKKLFGLDVTEESLPQDISQAVLELLGKQQWRAAIGLLYRASLVQVMANKDVRFFQGDTEDDCLARINALNDAQLSQYFKSLNYHWIMLAWAHRQPDAAALSELANRWQRVFKEASHEQN